MKVANLLLTSFGQKVFVFSGVAFAVCLGGRAALPAQTIARSEIVLVPAGPFLMGSDSGPEDEHPQHRLELAAFSIDRTPVTNAQLADFLNAVGPVGKKGERLFDVDDRDARIRSTGGKWVADVGFEKHPVVEASWFGAVAYCLWAGKRLPTEAEWEKAARGTDGRKYPWGQAAPDALRARYSAGWNETSPVGSFPKGASPYGVLDLAGNTWEWVSSAYAPYPYNPGDGREDMVASRVRGTRGGGHDSPPDELTTTHRGKNVSRNYRSGHHNIGFRCAR